MTMLRRIGFSALMLMITNAPLLSQDADDILSDLQDKYESISDATVTFTQYAVFGVTKAEQNFTGKLTMKKGNKYRLEMEDQTVVTDGKSVWTYSPLNKQVIIDHYREDPKSFSPDKLLTNVPDNYEPAVLGKEKVGKFETTILKLTPKSRSSVKWMKLWVDTDENLMRKLQVFDAAGNTMTYVLDTIKLNTDVKEVLFTFPPPEGTEVVDLR